MSLGAIVATIIGVIVLIAVFEVVLFRTVRRAKRKRNGEAMPSRDIEFEGASAVVPALMQHGINDSGGSLNGNGWLGVFPTEIRFALRVPKRIVVIERSAIRAGSVQKNLKLPGVRRAGGGPYLLVEWNTPFGVRTTAFATAHARELHAELFSGVT